MTQIVQIPPPSSPQFGQSVKQWIETRDGTAGPKGFKPDRFVVVKDLYDTAFINALANYRFPITRTNSDYGYTGDVSAPNPPTNLVVTTEVFRNTLTWDDPASENFWYIEVWLAKVPAGDPAPTTSDALKIATVPKGVEKLIDTEVSSTLYDHYYWIKAVSYAGIASVWQDGYIEGVTTINATIENIMDILRGADPDAWSSVVNYVAGDRVLHGGKRYKCILANLNQEPPDTDYWEQSGILITGDVGGISTVGIDGNLVVDESIYASAINTDNAFIGMTIQSTVFTEGSVGWQINKAGNVEFNDGVFRGMVAVGSLVVDASGFIKTSGKDSFADTTSGFYLGYEGGAYKLNLGDSTKYLKWDGSALTIRGTLNADDITAGTIGAARISVTNLAAISANLGTITAGSLSAALITSGTLSADRIGVTSISADKIVVGTITATQIYSDAYLGGKRLDNYAEGSTTVGADAKVTITHSLGRRAIADAWCPPDCPVADTYQQYISVVELTTTYFKLYNRGGSSSTVHYAYI
jgi:hypothetical protein